MALTFARFVVNTRDVQIGSPEEVVNAAAKNNYTGAEMMMSAGTELAVRGGLKIRDNIKLTANGNYGTYRPGQERSPTPTVNNVTISIPMRFSENSEIRTDAELTLNEGESKMSMWKRESKIITQDLETAHWNGMEDQLHATPVVDMETGPELSDAPPLSIDCFITDDGLVPSGFTTLLNVSSTTYPNWRSKFKTYNSADPSNNTGGLFSAFHQIMRAISYRPPANATSGVFTPDKSDLFIRTDDYGMSLYQACLAGGNDQWLGAGSGSDPSYSAPKFMGQLLRYTQALDGRYTATQPKFDFINKKFLFPVFNPEYFRRLKTADGGIKQDDVQAVFMRSWFNLFCRDRSRLGRVKAA
jgi:hypothetical protein